MRARLDRVPTFLSRDEPGLLRLLGQRRHRPRRDRENPLLQHPGAVLEIDRRRKPIRVSLEFEVGKEANVDPVEALAVGRASGPLSGRDSKLRRRKRASVEALQVSQVPVVEIF